MLSLMDLPPEIRIKIFGNVFRSSSNDVELVLDNKHYIKDNAMRFTNWPEPESRTDRRFRWLAIEYETNHPLFSTCKQIRQEALDRFRIRLSVTKRFRVRCTQNVRGKLTPLLFTRKNEHNRYDWVEHNERLPDGVVNDNYRNLLIPLIRERINVIHLDSFHGLDCDYINRTQFPLLELVVVEEIIDTRLLNFESEPTSERPKEMRLEHRLRYTLQEGENPYDIRAGKRDNLLIGQAKVDAHKYTLQNIPSLQERGFRIQVVVKVSIDAPRRLKGAAADLVIVDPS